MKSKIYTILIIFLLTALVILAGLFYWQSRQPNEPASPEESTQNKPTDLPEQEQEIVTSTPPFQIKDEISRGNPNKKQIIFTFDGGAGINSAQKILEITKKHGIKTTFLVTGKFAEKNSGLIKQIAAEGHEIFNHTYSHPHMPQLTDDQIKEELEKAENIISGLSGETTKPYFRPPYKERDERVLKIAGELGWQSVIWTTDALDWIPGKTEVEVKEKIYSGLQNGAIILMHVGDDITGNILDEVFNYIQNQGYQIVSLSEGLK